MIHAYFQIKDQCRQGLVIHLENILSRIPRTSPLRMLDIGCGTGVPTLLLADYFSGSITAIDMDQPALDYFQQKIDACKYRDRINILNTSLFDFTPGPGTFDLILAEGLLNVVGFEKGFASMIELLRPGGTVIIHDEFKNHEEKKAFMVKNNCRLTDTLYLDESIWWNDYYNPLNNYIQEINDIALSGYFERDITEIAYYKTDPTAFRSIYFLVSKNDP